MAASYSYLRIIEVWHSVLVLVEAVQDSSQSWQAATHAVTGLGTARVSSSNKPAASGGLEEGQGASNRKGGNNSWPAVTVLCIFSTNVETLVGCVSSYTPSNSSTLLLGSVSGS